MWFFENLPREHAKFVMIKKFRVKTVLEGIANLVHSLLCRVCGGRRGSLGLLQLEFLALQGPVGVVGLLLESPVDDLLAGEGGSCGGRAQSRGLAQTIFGDVSRLSRCGRLALLEVLGRGRSAPGYVDQGSTNAVANLDLNINFIFIIFVRTRGGNGCFSTKGTYVFTKVEKSHFETRVEKYVFLYDRRVRPQRTKFKNRMFRYRQKECYAALVAMGQPIFRLWVQ